MAATATAAWAMSYNATVSPGSVPAGSSTTFDVALSDTSGAGSLGSAIIVPPLKFTVTGATLDGAAGKVFFVLKKKLILLTFLGMEPGQSVDLLVTATAPTTCKTYYWFTRAFTRGFKSERLQLDSAPSLATSVTCP